MLACAIFHTQVTRSLDASVRHLRRYSGSVAATIIRVFPLVRMPPRRHARLGRPARRHVFGRPLHDVPDMAAPRVVTGSDASSTYVTWPPRASPLSRTRLPHSDALRIATPCGTSSSLGRRTRHRLATHIYNTTISG